jgi:dUTP pyrophosphatase
MSTQNSNPNPNPNSNSNYLSQDLVNVYGKYMYLKIFIDSDDEELKKKYAESINERDLKMKKDIYHIDAGFDLFSPSDLIMNSSGVQKLDYKIICSARLVGPYSYYNTGFYMYPRSSISKSKLRLANSVGIIDAGYRGHLIGMFDVIYEEGTAIHKFDRHLQICAPGLFPIIVEMMDTIEELGESTARGDGGFGSTGI